jgi:Pectate lyase superfamily protein
MPLPSVPIVGNVRDYGARGDNITDDTAAFERAFADPKVIRTINAAAYI